MNSRDNKRKQELDSLNQHIKKGASRLWDALGPAADAVVEASQCPVCHSRLVQNETDSKTWSCESCDYFRVWCWEYGEPCSGFNPLTGQVEWRGYWDESSSAMGESPKESLHE